MKILRNYIAVILIVTIVISVFGTMAALAKLRSLSSDLPGKDGSMSYDGSGTGYSTMTSSANGIVSLEVVAG